VPSSLMSPTTPRSRRCSRPARWSTDSWRWVG
jgi:hypothetical protein